MKNLPAIIAGIVLGLILLLYMCTYQVRFTEAAVVKTLGHADRNSVKTDANLYFRWPWPIQEVVTFDMRVRVLDDKLEETPTRDSKNLTVTTFAGWRIDDPLKFHTSFDTVDDAEAILRTEIRAQKKAVIGQYDLSQFISIDPNKRKIDQIENEMLSLAQASVKGQYGVTIELFGIKKLTLPKSVTTTIFETMRKNEERKAAVYKSEGEAAASEIRAAAQETRQRIMAIAVRKADAIRDEGQKAVGSIYKRFGDHPELAIFLDEIKALGDALKDRTQLVLTTDLPIIRLFDSEHRASIQPGVPGQEKSEEQTAMNAETIP
jgi:membrane protease subunit HflC